jgi:hypothetical protein
MMNYECAVQDWLENILPHVVSTYEADGVPDYVARSESWNDYTDSLCRDGLIFTSDYEDWEHPVECGQ